MGRTLENKQKIVANLKETLSKSQLAVVIDYQGLSVAQITDLRRRLRPSQTVCRVTKNTLMNLAVQGDSDWEPMTQFLSGSSVFLLVEGDISAAIKAYLAFQKDAKKTELRGGVMQGQSLNKDQLKAIADLPSKEQLIAQIAGAINGLSTKIARAIKEVPTSVGRGIQAIADKEEDKAA